jgi:hypothetical protein
MVEAMLHSDKMDEAFSMIEAVHKDAMDINNFDTMKTRKTDLVARFSPLNNTLMDRAPVAPSHSMFVTGTMGPPTTQPTEAKAQAVVQHEQLKMAQAPLDSNDQTQGVAEPPIPAMIYYPTVPSWLSNCSLTSMPLMSPITASELSSLGTSPKTTTWKPPGFTFCLDTPTIVLSLLGSMTLHFSLTFAQSCNMATTVLSVMTQELLSTTELSHRSSELLSRSPQYSSTSSANRELPNTPEMTVEMMMLVSDTSSMAWKPPWFCYQICKDISQVRCFFC